MIEGRSSRVERVTHPGGGDVMITIAVVNHKGGVGKTTIAFNLARWFSLWGKKVLAVDNDPQANLTFSLIDCRSKQEANLLDVYRGRPAVPQEVSENLFLIGSSVTLATVAERDYSVVYSLRDQLRDIRSSRHSIAFDYLLIDCLPSIGYLHLAALAAADYALIPITPSPYALMGLKDLFLTIRKTQRWLNPGLKILGVVLNLVDGRRLRLERKIESLLRENYGSLVFESKLSKRVRFAESPSFNKGIAEYHPNATSAKEFDCFGMEVVGRLGEGGEFQDLLARNGSHHRVVAKSRSVVSGNRRLEGGNGCPSLQDSGAKRVKAAGGRRRLKDLENMDQIFVRSIYRNYSSPKGAS
jgi:chromosome partitioning protein